MTTKEVLARSPSTTRDLLIVTCAVSAGVHAALAPEHLDETIAAGSGFIVATVLLAALAVALSVRPIGRFTLAAAALTFVGLLVSYALAVTSGMPVLMPEPEPVEGLALATKAVEVAGIVAASSLLAPLPFTRHEGASA